MNWYKGKDGKSFDSVLMIPATPGSELQQKIQVKAKQAGLKIKIVEKAGAKLGSYIKKFEKSKKKQNCGDKDCFVCRNSSKNSTKCRIPGAVYKITCIECEKQNKKACYYGETQFNGFTRGAQHQKNYRSKIKKFKKTLL